MDLLWGTVVKKFKPSASQLDLLYSSSTNFWDRDLFLEKAEGNSNTLILIKSDESVVLGFIMPDQWVDTSEMDDKK